MSQALFGWWVIDISSLITQKSSLKTHHPITHFLSLENSQLIPQLCLALKPNWVFILKTQKSELFVGPMDWLGAVKTERLHACGKEPLQFSLLCYYHFVPLRPIPKITKPWSLNQLHSHPLIEPWSLDRLLPQTHQTMELESPPSSSTHQTQKLSLPPSSSTQTQHPWKEKRNQAQKPNEKERKEKKIIIIETKPKNPIWTKKKKRRERWSYDVWLGKKEEQRKSKNKAKKKKSSNEREESYCGVGWHGFDNSQNIGPVSWVKLRKCHCNSISITQKHLFFFFHCH